METIGAIIRPRRIKPPIPTSREEKKLIAGKLEEIKDAIEDIWGYGGAEHLSKTDEKNYSNLEKI